MAKSAVGASPLTVLTLIDHETDAGNGLTYFCDLAGHQFTANPNGTVGWSDSITPNGAYQQWQKSGNLAYCTVAGICVAIAYNPGVPNS
jgi:hypothetical protein